MDQVDEHGQLFGVWLLEIEHRGAFAHIVRYISLARRHESATDMLCSRLRTGACAQPYSERRAVWLGCRGNGRRCFRSATQLHSARIDISCLYNSPICMRFWTGTGRRNAARQDCRTSSSVPWQVQYRATRMSITHSKGFFRRSKAVALPLRPPNHTPSIAYACCSSMASWLLPSRFI